MDFEYFDSEESKSSNMIGPYINIKTGRVSLGASMYMGGYDFSNEFRDIYDQSLRFDLGYVPEYDLSVKLKRTDLNFSLGYSLNRYFNVFAAYKSLNLTMDSEVSFPNLSGSEEESSDESSGSFMGGGLSVMVPFSGSPLFLFGSAAYLPSTGEDFEDDNLIAVTAGVGIYSQSGLSLMVGYRADEFQSDEDSDDALKINGIMATVAYTFR